MNTPFPSSFILAGLIVGFCTGCAPATTEISSGHYITTGRAGMFQGAEGATSQAIEQARYHCDWGLFYECEQRIQDECQESEAACGARVVEECGELREMKMEPLSNVGTGFYANGLTSGMQGQLEFRCVAPASERASGDEAARIVDNLGALRDLSELKKSGAISAEEFEKAKARILSGE
jgi:hypothetical protein